MPTQSFRDPDEFASDVQTRFSQNSVLDHTRIEVREFSADLIRALQSNTPVCRNKTTSGALNQELVMAHHQD